MSTVTDTTATAETVATADTAGSALAADPIPTLRGQIDAVDEAIRALVAERSRLSARVQAARINSGGSRVELGRERVIMNAYRDALGPQGPNLADAILQVCRGER